MVDLKPEKKEDDWSCMSCTIFPLFLWDPTTTATTIQTSIPVDYWYQIKTKWCIKHLLYNVIVMLTCNVQPPPLHPACVFPSKTNLEQKEEKHVLHIYTDIHTDCIWWKCSVFFLVWCLNNFSFIFWTATASPDCCVMDNIYIYILLSMSILYVTCK